MHHPKLNRLYVLKLLWLYADNHISALLDACVAKVHKFQVSWI
jgi:hypothetical protein